jgi:predicted O-methyltransferase YrrM
MIYLPPSVLGFMNKRAVFSTWTDHLPFGYDLVEALRPGAIVELGTQAGMSYFTFCQSVREHGIAAQCYAVDTWSGDEHTGLYDESMYLEVAEYNSAHYADFSELLRMRFEEAVHRFESESIDLLHIDGFHTYEAVRGDFEAWYPKVAPGGVVLFHDIAARIMDFGAWRYWDELTTRHSTFAFRHGFGLGVLRKTGGAPPEAPLLRFLFSDNEETARRLRAFYVYAGRHVDMMRHRSLVEELKARVAQKRREGASGPPR